MKYAGISAAGALFGCCLSHGKEGVAGSSPAEGFGNRAVARFSCLRSGRVTTSRASGSGRWSYSRKALSPRKLRFGATGSGRASYRLPPGYSVGTAPSRRRSPASRSTRMPVRPRSAACARGHAAQAVLASVASAGRRRCMRAPAVRECGQHKASTGCTSAGNERRAWPMISGTPTWGWRVERALSATPRQVGRCCCRRRAALLNGWDPT